MLQSRVGAYSATPFFSSLLAKAIHASFLFADYLPKELPYRKLYLNLIFAGTSFIGSFIQGHGQYVRSKNLYMRAHYERCDEIVKLCHQLDFIKEENGQFLASSEIMLIREVLLRTWKRVFDKNGYSEFSEFDETKIMDCTLNILNALVLKFADIKQARLDQELILSENLKSQVVDEISSLVSSKIEPHNGCRNLTCLHMPSYKSFTEVPSINTFSVVLNQIFYEQLSGKSEDLEVSDTSSSTIVKIPSKPHKSAIDASYYGDGGLVKSKLFYKISGDDEKTKLLKKAGGAIFDKAGSKATIRSHHLLHLISGFIKTIPFFDSFDENKSAPPWLKFLVGALAFVVAWLLDSLFRHIDNSFYSYRNEYDKFRENVIDLVHRNILSTDGKNSISTENENFKKLQTVIAQTIDEACKAHEKTYKDLSEADLGFITAKLFNCLSKVLKAENEFSRKIMLPTMIINSLTKELSKELTNSLSDKIYDKAGKGRVSGLVVSSGLKEVNVCSIICNVLSEQLNKEQFDYILKINQSITKSVSEGGSAMPLSARDADNKVKESLDREKESPNKRLFKESISRESTIARDGSKISL